MDDRYAALDMASRTGFTMFCQAQAAGFKAMQRHADRHTASQIKKMVDCFCGDLETLGATPLPTPSVRDDVHPLACAYLAGGSRMGSKVLRKRWLATSDPLVKRANNYFSLPSDGSEWHKLCEKLAAFRADTREADQVVSSSKALFVMFAALAPNDSPTTAEVA